MCKINGSRFRIQPSRRWDVKVEHRSQIIYDLTGRKKSRNNSRWCRLDGWRRRLFNHIRISNTRMTATDINWWTFLALPPFGVYWAHWHWLSDLVSVSRSSHRTFNPLSTLSIRLGRFRFLLLVFTCLRLCSLHEKYSPMCLHQKSAPQKKSIGHKLNGKRESNPAAI